MENNMPGLCPICGSSDLTRAPEFIRCIRCGIVRTIHSYNSSMYGEDYAYTYLKYSHLQTNTPLNLSRLGLVSRWIKSEGSILDIGCCIGEFIRFAEKFYPCTGFEPNPFALKWAYNRVHSPIISNLNGQILPVDVITMFDVLEHIEDPLGFLLLISKYLKSSGVLTITTPSIDFIAIQHPVQPELYYSWKHFKPKEHLFLYSKQGLSILLNRAGFKAVYWGTEESDIRPGNPNGDIMTCVARRSQ